MSLLQKFVLGSVPLTLLLVLFEGQHIARRIEEGVVQRTAGIAAVYFESMLAHRLEEFTLHGALTPQTYHMLDEVFVRGPLAQRVVRFKLWSPDGRIRYSSDPSQIGLQFPMHDHHAIALSGQIVAAITDLDGPDNARERAVWSRLLEIYLPLNVPGSGTVGAVAEFYHEVDSLQTEIAEATRQAWITLALGALLVYALLYAVVLRANQTIVSQRSELDQRVRQLEGLLAENCAMRERLQQAGLRSTALAELSLRRVAADLHDGPAQNLAYVLLRLEELPVDSALAQRLRNILDKALRQVRGIAVELAAPAMAALSLRDAIEQAVEDGSHFGRDAVECHVPETLPDAALAIRVAAYRVVREAVTNALRHAPGRRPRVRAAVDGNQLIVEVADDGPGFDTQAPVSEGHLGLALLRERVQLIGGEFAIDSAPGRGTVVRAILPLLAHSETHGENSGG